MSDILRYKLEEVWTALRVSTFSKLAFMRKYASSAADFLKAIDLWGEAACGMFIRQQLLDLLEKLDKKLVVYPYSIKSFLALFGDPYLPDSFVLLSNDLVSSREELPLSYSFLQMFLIAANEMFSKYGVEITSEEDTRTLIHHLLDDVVNVKILTSVKETHEELEDVVTYDGKNVKDIILASTERGHKQKEAGAKK